jgi:prepilin-type N-terminal cleavage/methylation domain-containing protein
LNRELPNRSSPGSLVSRRGFTYVELMITLAIASLIILGLSGVVGQALQSQDAVSEKNKLTRDARFAMQRMLRTVANSRRLLLPYRDKPASNWPENIREQTVPASAPIGDSTFATAVLAVTLPAYVDLDNDGYPDADDDRDGLIDEDLPNDNNHDFFPGIMLIDDDGDGQVDESPSYWWDDDETLAVYNEDPLNGIDDDGDNNVDEDTASDQNGDGCPGICGVDDDGDGTIDEGNDDDDDEDGSTFDDPYDPVVYHLSAGNLVERMPAPWDTDGISVPDGPVDGRDFIESVIAENVTRFRVERLDNGSVVEVIELTLELTSPLTGETVSLQSQIRIGSAL